MQINLFHKALTDFLSVYMPQIRNASHNTITSYCDTFRLFLQYLRDEEDIAIGKVTIDMLNSDLVNRFLFWLGDTRNSSINTRNQRLACLQSFAKYLQGEYPDKLISLQNVVQMKHKKRVQSEVEYLTVDDVKLLLSQPDISTISGRRDLTLLSVMYDTGARVQEIVDLRVRDLRLETPAHIQLTGKGRKVRFTPLLEGTWRLLSRYLEEHRLTTADKLDAPLFNNRAGNRFTRAGITYILTKYAAMAKAQKPLKCDNITPHLLRHTKAMHLLQAGINIIYIRDLLGHTDVKTTTVYARADMQMKREALEKADWQTAPPQASSWNSNSDLMGWLGSFGKQRHIM